MDKKLRRTNETYAISVVSLHFCKISKFIFKEDKFIYIICNLDKLKKSDVSPVEEENERDETYQGNNTCIDSARTDRN